MTTVRAAMADSTRVRIRGRFVVRVRFRVKVWVRVSCVNIHHIQPMPCGHTIAIVRVQ